MVKDEERMVLGLEMMKGVSTLLLVLVHEFEREKMVVVVTMNRKEKVMNE